MELNKEIIINGVNQSSLLSNRINSFTIKESETLEVSSLVLQLDNSDNKIIPPTKNATTELNIGYKQVFNMGKFVVQLIENNHSTIILTALAQDLTKGRVKQNKVFKNQPLSSILNTLANNLGLTLQLDPVLSPNIIPYLLQQNQTDLSLLHELGELFYSIAMIKDGSLVFWDKDTLFIKPPIILNDYDILNISYKDTEYKVYKGV